MKKVSYTKPEVKIATFCSADIITASGALAKSFNDDDAPATPINTTGMLGFSSK